MRGNFDGSDGSKNKLYYADRLKIRSETFNLPSEEIEAAFNDLLTVYVDEMRSHKPPLPIDVNRICEAIQTLFANNDAANGCKLVNLACTKEICSPLSYCTAALKGIFCNQGHDRIKLACQVLELIPRETILAITYTRVLEIIATNNPPDLNAAITILNQGISNKNEFIANNNLITDPTTYTYLLEIMQKTENLNLQPVEDLFKYAVTYLSKDELLSICDNFLSLMTHIQHSKPEVINAEEKEDTNALAEEYKAIMLILEIRRTKENIHSKQLDSQQNTLEQIQTGNITEIQETMNATESPSTEISRTSANTTKSSLSAAAPVFQPTAPPKETSVVHNRNRFYPNPQISSSVAAPPLYPPMPQEANQHPMQNPNYYSGYDPFDVSLSANQGQGRCYFYPHTAGTPPIAPRYRQQESGHPNQSAQRSLCKK